MKARLATTLAATLLLCAPAVAQSVIVNDNFDGYADQAAFEAVWAPIGGGSPAGSLGVIGGTLSTEQAVSPTFSVKNVSPPAFVPPEPTTSAYSQRNQHTFTESGTISTTLGIRFSFDFYDLAPTASPYRQFVNLQDNPAPTLTNQLVGLGMNNNQLGTAGGGQFYMARILGYTPPVVDPDGGPDEGGTPGSGSFFKLNDLGAPHRTEGWHNLKVEMTTDDGLSTDFSFFVDNVLVEKVSNFGTDAQFRSYDTIRMGSGNSSTQDAYYDNMFVETFTVGQEPTDDADFDGDGDVDGADLLAVQRGLGITTGALPTDGDANGDGDVDADDFGAWKTQFGTVGATGAGGAIPEPASFALVATALCAAGAARRRRTR
jgi:hypothetical protein